MMIKKLFNPFIYLAGSLALGIGVIIILITSFIGYSSHTHFPDVLSVKSSLDLPVLYYIIQNMMNWIIVSTILYGFAVVFSKSRVRLTDIYGTQAVSRFPYLLAALTGFSDSLEKFGRFLLWQLLEQGSDINISSLDIAIAITLIFTTLVLTLWMITLMFNAYKVSANMKGAKLIVSFIISLIISILISALFTNQLIQYF